MPPKIDIAEKIHFIDICGVLEKIQKAQDASNKEKHLRRYIESFNEFRKKFEQENGNDCETSFYCMLRCFVPTADDARRSYNIRITTMGNLYVKILNLSPNGDDAQKLSYKSNVNDCKDYADVVYSVMRSRANGTPSQMSLAEVHKTLDIIAQSDRKGVECELTKFIQTTSAMEQKWLIRIILKSMHLGIGEQKIFSIFHPQAKDVYTRQTNLYKMCKVVEKGEALDITSGIEPFSHIKPMLCGKPKIAELESLLSSSTFYLETKMDGERFHLHMADEVYKYISRNGKNYTKNYGADVSEGNLTPLIANLFNIKVKNIILDGEMMVWDKCTASHRVKGENIDVKHLPVGGNLRPCFVVYDLLYLNDKSYLDIPNIERVSLLRKILKEQIGVLKFCNRTKIQSPEHFRDLFNEAMKKEEEGVVIKSHTSVYKPGSRNGGWHKIKPDYIDGITSDLDLLIIGGFYNRLKTYINSYILGVCKKSSNEQEIPMFYSVGTVSQGLSLSEHKLLNEMLKPHWKTGTSPNFLKWGTTIPDVWINPSDSVILQIRASELAQYSAYRTSHSLRFPRVDVVRRDKIWSECMTLEEFEELCKGDSNVKKITKRALNSEDFNGSKKTKIELKKSNGLNPYVSKFQADEINKVSDEFSGISICILSTYKGGEITPEHLKEIVIKHGGKIVDTPLLDSKKCFCVAGDITYRVKRIKETGLYNIVSLDWLLRAFKEDTVCSDVARPKPRDMICTTDDMREEFEKYFDQYGDSYTSHVDEEEMQLLLKEIDSKNLKPLLESEIKDLEQELYENSLSPNFYRGICGHFYSLKSRMGNLAKFIFEIRGGKSIVDYQQSEQRKRITYIFVDTLDVDMMQLKQWLNANFAKRLNVIKAISCDWVFSCDRENKIIDLSNFVVKF